eukprot:573662-Lingulodinium_polyedra.AAC.1
MMSDLAGRERLAEAALRQGGRAQPADAPMAVAGAAPPPGPGPGAAGGSARKRTAEGQLDDERLEGERLQGQSGSSGSAGALELEDGAELCELAMTVAALEGETFDVAE